MQSEEKKYDGDVDKYDVSLKTRIFLIVAVQCGLFDMAFVIIFAV